MDKKEIQDQAEGLLRVAKDGASEVFSAHLNHMSREDQLAVMQEMANQNARERFHDQSLPIIVFDTPTDGCGEHVDNVRILREKDMLDPSRWFGDKYDSTSLYELPPDDKMVCETAEAIRSRARQLQTNY